MIKLRQEIEYHKEKFLNAEKFSAMVYNHYIHNKGLVSHLDSIMAVCYKLGIPADEHEKIKRLITSELKQKIKVDCERKNMLDSESTPKLPTFI